MRKHLTGYDIFNELCMVRTKFAGSLLLLEGSTDCTLFDAFIDSAKCETIPAHGKPNAILAIQLADAANFRGVLGIIDADFDRLAGRLPTSPNLCFTDYQDMETMIFHTGVLERLILQYAKKEMLDAHLSLRGVASFRESVIESAKVVGALRWYSSTSGSRLKFKGIDFDTFVSQYDLTIDKPSFASSVIANTVGCSLSPQSLVIEIDTLVGTIAAGSHLCQGHDVCAIVGIGLRSVIGNSHTEVARARNVEKMLRMAFGEYDFIHSNVYAWIRHWEQANPTFQVLRN
jgi:hypothetical protein